MSGAQLRNYVAAEVHVCTLRNLLNSQRGTRNCLAGAFEERGWHRKFGNGGAPATLNHETVILTEFLPRSEVGDSSGPHQERSVLLHARTVFLRELPFTQEALDHAPSLLLVTNVVRADREFVEDAPS